MNAILTLPTINQQIFARDIELQELRVQCETLQKELAENNEENSILKESISQQKLTIRNLQEAVESGKRKSDTKSKHSPSRTGVPVRVIYKESSDFSGDEGSRSRSQTPGSFIMSSSDSFEI